MLLIIMDALKVKYPHIEVRKEICLATQVRQEAVAEQAGESDFSSSSEIRRVTTRTD